MIILISDKQFMRARNPIFFGYFAIALQGLALLINNDLILHPIFENKIFTLIVVIEKLY